MIFGGDDDDQVCQDVFALNTVSKTLEKVSEDAGLPITSGKGDPIFYDAQTNRVFASNSDDKQLYVISLDAVNSPIKWTPLF